MMSPLRQITVYPLAASPLLALLPKQVGRFIVMAIAFKLNTTGSANDIRIPLVTITKGGVAIAAYFSGQGIVNGRHAHVGFTTASGDSMTVADLDNNIGLNVSLPANLVLDSTFKVQMHILRGSVGDNFVDGVSFLLQDVDDEKV